MLKPNKYKNIRIAWQVDVKRAIKEYKGELQKVKENRER